MTKSFLNKAQFWGPDSLKQPIKALWNTLSEVRNKAGSMLEKALGVEVNDVGFRQKNKTGTTNDNDFTIFRRYKGTIK